MKDWHAGSALEELTSSGCELVANGMIDEEPFAADTGIKVPPASIIVCADSFGNTGFGAMGTVLVGVYDRLLEDLAFGSLRAASTG